MKTKNNLTQGQYNTLFLLSSWGILSAKLTALILGINLVAADRNLKKLAKKGLATDLGRTCLDPKDILYGRYFMIKHGANLTATLGETLHFKFSVPLRIGREKIVEFTGGTKVTRHFLFSTVSTFWVADFLMRGLENDKVDYYSESSLRHQFGWHGNMAPAKSAANPKPTMVPDGLIAVNGNNIRIEAETTVKSASAYAELYGKLSKKDDVVVYVFEDSKVKKNVSENFPEDYKILGVIFGDEQGLLKVFKRLLPSLGGQLFAPQPSL